MTTVHLPSPLHSYTGGRPSVEAEGATLGELLDRLEALLPGIRFRIVDEQGRVRPTILIYAGTEIVRDLSRAIPPGADVRIIAALSGG